MKKARIVLEMEFADDFDEEHIQKIIETSLKDYLLFLKVIEIQKLEEIKINY